MSPPPRQTEFPTLERGETYNTRISNLRTTLARGGITLRVAGAATTFETAECDPANGPILPFSGCVRCDLAGETTPVDGAVLEAATQEFQRYPTSVLIAANIDHVAMCTELEHLKKQATEVEHPSGVADVRGRGLLISLSYFLNRAYYTDATFSVGDITHHEVYHLLEFEHMQALMFDDPEWLAENPPGFVYGEGAKERQPGFVDEYAMTNDVEDKASVFEYLMVHPEDICHLASIEPSVKNKTRIIWQRVVKAVGTDSFMRTAAPCVDWI